MKKATNLVAFFISPFFANIGTDIDFCVELIIVPVTRSFLDKTVTSIFASGKQIGISRVTRR
jgi:Na+/H+ antiporter NhaA